MSALAGIGEARRAALLDAVLSFTADLPLPALLRRVVESAAALVDARYAALGVLDGAGRGLSDFITVGMDGATAAAIGRPPEGQGILGLLILDPRPIRLEDLSSHPDSHGFPPHHPPMSSFLGVPVRVRSHVFGNLYLTDKRYATAFTAEDETLVVALAAAAGIAIENARLHDQVTDLALVRDRERIAADLHDTVIQRLFATGLALQGAARRIPDSDLAARVYATVDDLDETIRQIRSAIFALNTPADAGRTVRQQIMALATEASASLGFEPDVHLDGPLDSAVSGPLTGHLLAVTREALSNIVRHAGAGRAVVEIAVADARLEARVTDDGVGVGAGRRVGGKGLDNLAHRARELGGWATVGPATDGRGTVVTWSVPLAAGAAGSG